MLGCPSRASSVELIVLKACGESAVSGVVRCWKLQTWPCHESCKSCSAGCLIPSGAGQAEERFLACTPEVVSLDIPRNQAPTKIHKSFACNACRPRQNAVEPSEPPGSSSAEVLETAAVGSLDSGCLWPGQLNGQTASALRPAGCCNLQPSGCKR